MIKQTFAVVGILSVVACNGEASSLLHRNRDSDSTSSAALTCTNAPATTPRRCCAADKRCARVGRKLPPRVETRSYPPLARFSR